MKILNKLSLKSLKLNKKRSIGTIIGIILSVALITAVAGMFESFQKSLVQSTIASTGYYHYGLSDIDPDTLKTVETNRLVKDIMKSYNLGISHYDRSGLHNAFVSVYSTDRFDDLPYNLATGNKPNNDREILVPTSLLDDAGLKLGDEIELDIGTRMTKDGFALKRSNPYNTEEGEYIANPVHKKYKIVGTYSGPGSRLYYSTGEGSIFYMALTTAETSSKIDAYVALKNPRERDDFLKSLYATGKFALPSNSGENLYTISTNYELLRWEVFAFSDETVSMLYTVVGIVIAIIVFTSIFCIRNSFAISTTEKAKMFGMLSSIGATKKQIKKSIISEAYMLAAIAIPIGILCGLFADFVLVQLVNLILKDSLFISSGGMVFHASYIACLVAVVLSIVTIYFSALSSAHRASRISPIDNIRSTKDITLKRESMKVPKIIEKIFKTGGVLAFKNLRRSKKKYRTTVISLSLSIFVFISMSSFLNDTFKVTEDTYDTLDYNIMILNSNSLTQNTVDKITSLDNIEEYHVLYRYMDGGNDYIRILDKDKINYGPGYELICEKYETGSDKCIGEKAMWLEVVGLDSTSFKKYADSLGVDYEEAKSTGILADKITVNDEETFETRRYKYKKGDTIEGILKDDSFEIEIGAIANEKPWGIERYNYDGGYLIVDVSSFDKIEASPWIVTIDSKNPDKLEGEIRKLFKDINLNNIDSINRNNKAVTLIASIFLYGFITVITLIGVTTIFNTITSNMELRSKEFAMLKSIGMTRKEFSRMINLETLLYSAKSLFYGITLGLIGSIAIHSAFGIRVDMPYQFPTIPILISILFVFVLVSIIMHFSISKINRQNTIETIRKDNI